jgi:nicotinamide riboside kinase
MTDYPQPSVFLIEGLDRLGKSTLVENIIDKLGYYQRLHFSKPKMVERYANAEADVELAVKYGVSSENAALFHYQQACFRNLFIMAHSYGRFICDRAHLGEAVYSNLYRGYDGNYVFDLEENLAANELARVRLILLVENFTCSKHFVDDGHSLGPESARAKEQDLFMHAFNRSIIRDKRVVSVTDIYTGQFRDPQDILEEVLAHAF